MKKTLVAICALFLSISAFSQTIKQMGFQNKSIQDILLTLADVSGTSIVCDETVAGNASFVFSSMDFLPALESFLNAYRLYYRFDHGVYYVSRVKAEKNPKDGTLTIDAEDIDPQLVLRAVSRVAGQTVLFDPLPKATVTIHSSGITLAKAVDMVVSRFPEYSVVADKDYLYVRKNDAANAGKAQAKKGDVFARTGEGHYSANADKVKFQDALDELMRAERLEYSMLMRGDTIIDRLAFSDRSFDQMLRLLLEQANADFALRDGVYYFFDIQRKDVLKKLKLAKSLTLRNVAAQDAIALLPQDFANSSLFRVDKATNTVYLSGSPEEINPIEAFLASIDAPDKSRSVYRYVGKFLKAKEIIAMLPPRFTAIAPIQTPNEYVFLMTLSDDLKLDFDEFIRTVDQKTPAVPVVLKFLKVEDLMKNLPPSVTKDDVQDSGVQSLIFFTGSEEKRERFLREIAAMDRPKPQIRYDILVMQYERGQELGITPSANLTRDVSSSTATAAGKTFPTIDGWSLIGTLSSALNIQFDLISTLGYTLVSSLNAKQSGSTSNVFADTSLTALSGQEAKFQSTTTVHYMNTETNETTGVTTTTGTAQSLSYGLIFGVNGWLSGDGMITMTVSATVSRSAESSSTSSKADNVLPNTTERVINTQLRVEAGKPVVISGLLQKEKIKTVSQVPILGSIPLLGTLFRTTTEKDNVTELTIYILPHIIPLADAEDRDADAIARYYQSFVRGSHGTP